MIFHAGAYLIVLGLCPARKRLSYPVKASVILALVFIVGAANFPSLGVAGSGEFFYLTAVVLATLFFGYRGSDRLYSVPGGVGCGPVGVESRLFPASGGP